MATKRCFVCDERSSMAERVRMRTSASSHSKTSFPDMIVDLIGDEYLVAVHDDDYACKKCGTMFNRIDKLECDLKIVKRVLLNTIEDKYHIGLVSNDPPDESAYEDEDEDKEREGVLEYARYASESMLPTNSASVLPDATAVTIAPPLIPSPETVKVNTEMSKFYKCGFCSYQSPDLPAVRAHLRIHVKNKATETVGESSSGTGKERLFQCQNCSSMFNDRVSCLIHIRDTHAPKRIFSTRPYTTAATRASGSVKRTYRPRVSAGPSNVVDRLNTKKARSFFASLKNDGAALAAARTIIRLNDECIAAAKPAVGKPCVNVGVNTMEQGIGTKNEEQNVPVKCTPPFVQGVPVKPATIVAGQTVVKQYKDIEKGKPLNDVTFDEEHVDMDLEAAVKYAIANAKETPGVINLFNDQSIVENSEEGEQAAEEQELSEEMIAARNLMRINIDTMIMSLTADGPEVETEGEIVANSTEIEY